MPNILFIVENDSFPQDIRVYNECKTIVLNYPCVAVAPRKKNEKFVDFIDGNIKCYHFPHFEAGSIALLPLEYLNAAFWLSILVPFAVFRHHIRIIHVANPPDFIIPLLSWLKIFGIMFIYDMHDLSTETFRGKTDKQGLTVRMILSLLTTFEKISILFADRIISTNLSIKEYVLKQYASKSIFVVRNSNPVRFQTITEIPKNESPKMNIGYFGIIANDKAAGIDNFIVLAKQLQKRKIDFSISVIGNGPGLMHLKFLIEKNSLNAYFTFHGFLPLELAFQEIIHFDFGIVTWGDIPKNHFHTAMKIMDYMCCGVPVCSLKLREQMYSTQNIAIHTETFEEMADAMVDIYRKKDEYEELRRLTLRHFNTVLCWENQSKELIEAYQSLIK